MYALQWLDPIMSLMLHSLYKERNFNKIACQLQGAYLHGNVLFNCSTKIYKLHEWHLHGLVLPIYFSPDKMEKILGEIKQKKEQNKKL